MINHVRKPSSSFAFTCASRGFGGSSTFSRLLLSTSSSDDNDIEHKTSKKRTNSIETGSFSLVLEMLALAVVNVGLEVDEGDIVGGGLAVLSGGCEGQHISTRGEQTGT